MEDENTANNSLLVRQLTDAIEENLANHLPQNAVFLAERLLAELDSEDTRGILAECYMAEDKIYKVFDVLEGCKSESNRYRFALSCLKLNKLEEGEKALMMDNQDYLNKTKGQASLDSVPNGYYGFYLLGLIKEARQRDSEAKECFKKALELNPTLWVAYEKICKISDLEIIPYKVFCETRYKQYIANKKNKIQAGALSFNPQVQFLKPLKESVSNQEEPVQQTKPRALVSTSQIILIAKSSVIRNDSNSRNSSAKRRKSSKLEGNSTLFNPAPSQQTQPYSGIPFELPQKLPPVYPSQQQISNGTVGQQFVQLIGGSNQSFQNQGTNQFSMSGQGQGNSLIANPLQGGEYIGIKQNNQMSSSQQQQQMFNIYSQGNQGNFGNSIINNQNFPPLNIFNSNSNNNGNNSNDSNNIFTEGNGQPIKDICTLLKRFGEAYYHMSLYLCKEAIQLLNSLPRNHYQTGWVLTHIGRCYMEIVKYSEAEKYYAEALRIEPYRLEGIEYYSSCLWHLKKQVELCYLAQQALDRSLLAPETWIAVGNCFSLQKEHENALKFFKRAIQLNPNSAYAHSLCGHEFVYNEDFARARRSFESALNFDLRNYNAWWGLGNIYYKQERYSRASEHFQKAININQKNPVLYSFMGMSLAADRKFKKALDYFESSEKLDPKNGLNKFQKANTLVKLENYDDALKELQELHLMMPKEAPIPMLMGKVYKKLKKIDMALKYFTDALDLENKDSQRIKALIESLHQDNHDFVEDLDL